MRKRLDWSAAQRKLLHEGRCRNCGQHAKKLDSAHIIPRAKAREFSAVTEERIVPLCRTCHRSYDERKLDLLPVLELDEQAAAVRDAGGIINALQRITNERWRTEAS